MRCNEQVMRYQNTKMFKNQIKISHEIVKEKLNQIKTHLHTLLTAEIGT